MASVFDKKAGPSPFGDRGLMESLESLLDPIIGRSGDPQYREAERIIDDLVNQYQYDLPEFSYDPENIDYAGDYNPTTLGQLSDLQSHMANVEADPGLRAMQMDELAALDEIITGGGMNAMDQANLARIQNQTATADRGRREAIQQRMRNRGMGGSGMDLLAQLDSSQAATTRQAQQGLDVAGMAQDRALDAIARSGHLAQGMEAQQFGQEAEKAKAREMIDRFNRVNQINRQQYNNQLTNNARLRNLDTRQGLNQSNTQIRNDAQLRNQGFKQQQHDNLARQRQGIVDARLQQARSKESRGYNKDAERQRRLDMLFNLGATAATAGG